MKVVVRRFVTLHPALCWCPDCGGFPTWQRLPPATTLTVQLADDEEPPKGWKRTATDEDGRMRLPRDEQATDQPDDDRDA